METKCTWAMVAPIEPLLVCGHQRHGPQHVGATQGECGLELLTCCSIRFVLLLY